MSAPCHPPGRPPFDTQTFENLRSAMVQARMHLPRESAFTLLLGQQILPMGGDDLIDRQWAERLQRAFEPGRRLRRRKCSIHAIEDPFPAILVHRQPTGRSDLRATLYGSAVLVDLCEVVLPAMLEKDAFLALEASSPSLSPMVNLLRRIAVTPISVLITGETGTGKEILGRALHAVSTRPGQFVAENCAALPEGLMESELFGYCSGAFTGASKSNPGRLRQAHRGTLFLDEIGDLPLALQAKLLRVLEERKVRPLGALEAHGFDARTLSATHRNLPRLIHEGQFRSDLYYRLAGSVIHLPPLRDRPADIPFLASALMTRIRREMGGSGTRLDPGACRALTKYRYSGNVRELLNILRESAALSVDQVITTETLARPLRQPVEMSNLEADAIVHALAVARGVKAGAARRLGWSRQKLYRRMAALKLEI